MWKRNWGCEHNVWRQQMLLISRYAIALHKRQLHARVDRWTQTDIQLLSWSTNALRQSQWLKSLSRLRRKAGTISICDINMSTMTRANISFYVLLPSRRKKQYVGAWFDKLLFAAVISVQNSFITAVSIFQHISANLEKKRMCNLCKLCAEFLVNGTAGHHALMWGLL